MAAAALPPMRCRLTGVETEVRLLADRGLAELAPLATGQVGPGERQESAPSAVALSAAVAATAAERGAPANESDRDEDVAGSCC